MFELTVPLDVNISQRNLDKSNKYAHFVKDITHNNTFVTAFKVSSTGNVSADKKKHLNSLHKFCNQAQYIHQKHLHPQHLLIIPNLTMQEQPGVPDSSLHTSPLPTHPRGPGGA